MASEINASRETTEPRVLTFDERRRARVTVARNAHGVEDCQVLLEMLDLAKEAT